MYNTDMPSRAELPSSTQLLRSTALAAAAAAAILVTVVLPSEYGIDPTGVGSALNLTEMGEIKTQLAEEAAADAALTGSGSANTTTPSAAGSSTVLSGDAPAIAVPPAPPAPPAPPVPERQSSILGTLGAVLVTPAAAQEMRQDEMTITLQPGEGAEIKLTMREGDVASYAWAASEGSTVNVDVHGDGGGQNISYEKVRGVASDDGQITAAFTGNHGWFWRNRGDEPIALTVRTNGTYSAIDRLI